LDQLITKTPSIRQWQQQADRALQQVRHQFTLPASSAANRLRRG
jgi:hypothetical protein